jgi:hypothetical protein
VARADLCLAKFCMKYQFIFADLGLLYNHERHGECKTPATLHLEILYVYRYESVVVDDVL